MRNILQFVLILSLLFSTACVTLSGAERCALIGQIQSGTHLGARTHISSYGDTIYSYSSPSYDPICKIPETDRERDMLAKITPVAEEKRKKKNTEFLIWLGSLPLIVIVVALFRDWE